MKELARVRQVKEVHAAGLLSRPNVVGVGVGLRQRRGRLEDEVCVVALVRRKRPASTLTAGAMVPTQLEGVATDVQEVGILRAQVDRRVRFRPAPGGVSVGHYLITAGTLGGVVRDRASGARLLLSNNHVLANSNEASVEDPILQPGPADGGREENDTFALLERFIPIAYSREPGTCGIATWVAKAGNRVAGWLGSKHRLETVRVDPQATNRVDAAVARPLIDSDLSDEILEIGVLTGTTPAVLGMAVRKSGRTTALTAGRVTVVEATVDVDYGGKTARFEGQILSGPMSLPGDSGSLLVEAAAPRAVGLLYAGSDQATIYNSIADVQDALGVSIG